MEGEENINDHHRSSPQLTGVVIITLPPPDNPSYGKTITAYTLSSSDHHHNNHHHDHDQPPPENHLPQQQQQQQPSVSFFNIPTRRNIILPILCVSLVALIYVWASFSPVETLFNLSDYDDNINDDDDRRDRNKSSQRTFLFPLYHKGGNSDDFEVKLGRLVGLEDSQVPLVHLRKTRPKSLSKVDDDTSSSSSVVPVIGNVYPDGLYYTYLHFGNPQKPYFLDIDTGSDLTWIQCDAPCTSCAKGAHPIYKPVKANIIPHKDTYCAEIQRDLRTDHCVSNCHQCDYEIEYADHSSSLGVLLRDEFHLNIANGSLVNSKVVFGCAYDQQGVLLNMLGKTDGMLGLSRAKISLPSQLASHGIIKNVIGHCLANEATGGGYLFLGDDFVPYRQMAWVPMLGHDLNSYQANMMKMSYGNRQIGLGDVANGQGRLAFDTGSSYTYFTEQAYNDLVTILNDVSSESFIRDMSDTSLPICWRAKSPLRSVKEVRQLFKPLNLQFGSKWWITSTKLQIHPEGYLVTNGKGNVCLGILNGREVHDGATFILGDISLRGLLVVYDNVKEKIGWVRSDCVRPQRFESHPVY